MKKYSVLFAALLALTAVSACQKKESAPKPATPAPADAGKTGDTTAPAPVPAPAAPAEKK